MRRVRDELEPDAQSIRHGAGHIRGDALRITFRGLAGDQQEVREIDAGPQDTGWCEFVAYLFEHENPIQV